MEKTSRPARDTRAACLIAAVVLALLSLSVRPASPQTDKPGFNLDFLRDSLAVPGGFPPLETVRKAFSAGKFDIPYSAAELDSLLGLWPRPEKVSQQSGDEEDKHWWDGFAPYPQGQGMNNVVSALTVYEGELIAGGIFSEAGGVPAGYIARWDGGSWRSLGSGMNYAVFALTVYNGELIAGGFFTQAGGVAARYIARWDGSSWKPLGTGMNGWVYTLAVYNGELIAGGFCTQAGGVPAGYIARWDGSSWKPLGTGMNDWVHALAVYNGELIAAGAFTQAGGVPARYIARWDGNSWKPLGDGMNYPVIALTVYSGMLIAGGSFTQAGGVPARYIARWDGNSWKPLGTGMNDWVLALTVYNGELIATGCFTQAGGVPASQIARWDGSSWKPLGSGLMAWCLPGYFDLEPYNGDLYVGGLFFEAGGKLSWYIARWRGDLTPRVWYVDAAGSPEVDCDFTSIQSAINYAYNGDTILVAPGIYYENLDFRGRNVVVLSEEGPLSTAIDASASGPAVKFVSSEDSTAVLEGFTVRNASDQSYYGAGIICKWSSPVIRNNIIEDNSCRMGGISCYSGGSPLIEGNVIRRNTAYTWGGAISGDAGAAPIIRHNLIHGNKAFDHGQALRFWGCPGVVIENNTLVEHTYPGGSSNGGVIESDQGSHLIIRNNIIADNLVGVQCTAGGTVSLSCNDVWNNGQDYVNCSPGAGDISEDPLFCDPVEENYRLLEGSPCAQGYGCGLIGAFNVGCVASEIPDIAIYASDVAFLPATPYENEATQILVTLRNESERGTSAFDLEVFEGNPDFGGALIESVRIDSLGPTEVRQVSIAWRPPCGESDVFVVADRAEEVPERSELNNVVRKKLSALCYRGFQVVIDPQEVEANVGQAVKFDVTVANLDSVGRPVVLALTGLPPGWSTLEPESLYLGPGTSQKIDLQVNVPEQCTGSTQQYTLSVEGISQNPPATASGSASLTVHDEPLVSDLSPLNGQLMAANDVSISWRTPTETTTEVFYKSEDDTAFATVTAPPGVNHQVILSDLAWGARYEWYARSTGPCGVTETEHRYFTVGKGVVFSQPTYTFRVDRDYMQQVEVTVTNEDIESHEVELRVIEDYEDLIVGFIGSGSVDEVVTLGPGESLPVILVIQAQDVQSHDYTLRLELTSDENTGNPIVDNAVAQVEVWWPEYAFHIEEVSFDSTTLARRFRVVNDGNTAITDLAIRVEEALGAGVYLRPTIQHGYLPKNGFIEFAAYTVFNKSLLGKTLSAQSGGCSMTLTATGGGTTASYSGENCCSDPLAQVYEVHASDVLVCGENKDWYCTNKPDIVIYVDFPPGASQGDADAAALALTFNPRSNVRPHDVYVSLNGHEIGALKNTVPKGTYRFTFDPSILNKGEYGTVRNSVRLKTVHMNGGHYIVSSAAEVCVCKADYAEYICARTEEEARSLLLSRPYIRKLPGTAEVEILEPADRSTVFKGMPVTIKALVTDGGGIPIEGMAVGAVTCDVPATMVMEDVGQGMYEVSWTPSEPGPCGVTVTAGGCGGMGSAEVEVLVDEGLGRITGRVYDYAGGAGLGSAVVTVTNPDLSPVAEVQTLNDGTYSIELFPGDYLVSASKSDYCPSGRVNVGLSPGEADTVDYALLRSFVQGEVWWSQYSDLDSGLVEGIPVYLLEEGKGVLEWGITADGRFRFTGLDCSKKYRVRAAWKTDTVAVYDNGEGGKLLQEYVPSDGYHYAWDKEAAGSWNVIFVSDDAKEDYEDAKLVFENVNEAHDKAEQDYSYDAPTVNVYIRDDRSTPQTNCSGEMFLPAAVALDSGGNTRRLRPCDVWHEYGHFLHFSKLGWWLCEGLTFRDKALAEGWAMYFSEQVCPQTGGEKDIYYCESIQDDAVHRWGDVYSRVFHDVADGIGDDDFDGPSWRDGESRDGNNRIWHVLMEDKITSFGSFYDKIVDANNAADVAALDKIYGAMGIKPPGVDLKIESIQLTPQGPYVPGDKPVLTVTVWNKGSHPAEYKVCVTAWRSLPLDMVYVETVACADVGSSRPQEPGQTVRVNVPLWTDGIPAEPYGDGGSYRLKATLSPAGFSAMDFYERIPPCDLQSGLIFFDSDYVDVPLQSNANLSQLAPSYSAEMIPGGTVEHLVPIDPSCSKASFTASWSGSSLGLELVTPSGETIDSVSATADSSITVTSTPIFRGYLVATPDPGLWTVRVIGESVPAEGEPFTVRTYLGTDLELSTETAQPVYAPSETVNVLASLTKQGVGISGATVRATVMAPDSTEASVDLFDDGAHGDGAPSDGRYGGYFDCGGTEGYYRAVVVATGKDADGYDFGREATVWFAVSSLPDLAVDSTAISVIPEEPFEGDTASVSVWVRNVGYGPSDSTGVVFWDGSPNDPASSLITYVGLPPLGPYDSVQVSAPWFIPVGWGGSHELYVQVDPGYLVSEAAENNNDVAKAVTVRKRLITLSTTLPTATWTMLSVPASPVVAAVDSVLGDDLGPLSFGPDSGWMLTRWEKDRFKTPEELEPGKGYWIYVKGTASDSVTVDVSGYSTPSNEPFTVRLSKGWNQIGTPRSSSVSWDSAIQVGVWDSAGYHTIPIEEAESTGVCRNVVWWLDGKSFNFGSTSPDDSTEVSPWVGYYCYSYADSCELKFPPVEAGIAKPLFSSLSPAPMAGDPYDWKFAISATSGLMTDRFNYFGVSPRASVGFDQLDVEKLNPFPPYVSLRFVEESWQGHPREYARDIKTRADSIMTWNLEVESVGLPEGPITLRWEAADSSRVPLALFLEDLDDGNLIDMLWQTSYSVTPNANGQPRRLRILAFGTITALEDSPIVPLRFRVDQNFPNPFSGATVIRYAVPQRCRVEIRVFDVRGRLVKTLVDKEQAPSYYSVRWDGTNNSSRRVASGIYFVRVQVGENEAARKVVRIQ